MNTQPYVLHVTCRNPDAAVTDVLDLLHASDLSDTHTFGVLETDCSAIDWDAVTQEFRRACIAFIHIPVAIATLPTIQEFGRLAARFGCTTVLVDSVHSPSLTRAQGIQPQWLQWLFQAASQCVHCIATTSVAQGQWLQTFLDACKVKVVPACCDLSAFRAIAPRLRLPKGLVAVAPSSQGAEEQGFDTILEAARQLRDVPIQILIAGSVPHAAD
ncbi:MAG: hypothetical protein AAFX40_19025, partial [Cyanobacteria bacterium J06639_1]